MMQEKTRKEHLQIHFELCKRIYLRLVAEGTLHETLGLFAEEKASAENGDLEV